LFFSFGCYVSKYFLGLQLNFSHQVTLSIIQTMTRLIECLKLSSTNSRLIYTFFIWICF